MNMEFTETQLTKLTKKDIIGMCISLQQLVESLTTQCEKQQERFGSSTEKVDWEGQLEMLFNEDEVLIVDKYVVEPTLEQVCPELNNVTTKKRSPRPKGKREEDLAGLPIKIIEHTLCETELQEKFGSTQRRLPDEVYKCLAFHPATFEVEEHQVAVYTSKADGDETVVKAPIPEGLLRHSIVTSSLEAAILNGKYVNAIPL